jgi:hypothetical protein
MELDIILTQLFQVLAAALALGGLSNKLDGRAAHGACRLAQAAKAVLANGVVAVGRLGILGKFFEANAALDVRHV